MHGKIQVLVFDANSTLELSPRFLGHTLDGISVPSLPRSYLLRNHTGQGPVGLGVWENSVQKQRLSAGLPVTHQDSKGLEGSPRGRNGGF